MQTHFVNVFKSPVHTLEPAWHCEPQDPQTRRHTLRTECQFLQGVLQLVHRKQCKWVLFVHVTELREADQPVAITATYDVCCVGEIGPFRDEKGNSRIKILQR